MFCGIHIEYTYWVYFDRFYMLYSYAVFVQAATIMFLIDIAVNSTGFM